MSSVAVVKGSYLSGLTWAVPSINNNNSNNNSNKTFVELRSAVASEALAEQVILNK